MRRLSAFRSFVLPKKRVRSGWICTYLRPVMLLPTHARRAVSFCAGPRQSPHESSGSAPRPTLWRRGHHTNAPPPAGRAWCRTRLENHHPYTHGAPGNQRSLDQVAAGEIFSITCQSPPVAYRVLRPSLSKRAGLQVRLHVDIQVFSQNSGAESGNTSREHN